MTYCLNNNELEKLLRLYLNGTSVDDIALESHVSDAGQWDDNLLCITFSLARVLERQRDSEQLIKMMIVELFSMPDKLFLGIQECDEDFVDYMLRHEHCGDSDMEVSLLRVAQNLTEYCYDKKTLRDRH